MDYVNNVIPERVAQIHIAGHTRYRRYILDTHDHPVIPAVWQLYAQAVKRTGPTATLLEWDAQIPSFDEVHHEASKPMSSLRKSKPHQPLPGARSARSLRDFQRLVAGLLMCPLDKGFKMQRRTKTGRSQPVLISRLVKPSKSLTPFERLGIYNRQYWFRILECFYDDFVGLRAVLGDDRFLRLAVILPKAQVLQRSRAACCSCTTLPRERWKGERR